MHPGTNVSTWHRVLQSEPCSTTVPQNVISCCAPAQLLTAVIFGMQAIGMIGYNSRCAGYAHPTGLLHPAIQLALPVLLLQSGTSAGGLLAHFALQMLADKPSAVSTLCHWPQCGISPTLFEQPLYNEHTVLKHSASHPHLRVHCAFSLHLRQVVTVTHTAVVQL